MKHKELKEALHQMAAAHVPHAGQTRCMICGKFFNKDSALPQAFINQNGDEYYVHQSCFYKQNMGYHKKHSSISTYSNGTYPFGIAKDGNE
jgi:hypothetical protein